MSTTHEVPSAGASNTKFYLAALPDMGKHEFEHRLRQARTDEERKLWFADVFYWLYEGHEIRGDSYGRSGAILAMLTPEYATLRNRATKDKKTLRAFFDKITADEPEQKPAEETV